MRELWTLPVAFYYLLAGLVFTAGVFALLLCVYRYHNRDRKNGLLDGGVFLLLFAATVVLSASLQGRQVVFKLPVDWRLVLAFVTASYVYLFLRFLVARKRYRHSLTPDSVKEALDNLGTCILFADDSGRVLLKNHKMSSFCFSAAGIDPQTLQDLQLVLHTLNCIDDAAQLYRTLEHKVWQYRQLLLTEPSLAGFTQVTIEDVTELYEANQLLKENNEALKQTNEKISLMLERLADRIREQETLALKTQIHNDIGVSLIALSKLFYEGTRSDVDAQINVLQNAVGYFANNRLVTEPDSVQNVKNHAAALGVTLNIEGDYSACEALVAHAAEVCITNCVYHAGGNSVRVEIRHAKNHDIITLTNNGLKPAGPIVEGGGLSALRKKAESDGGSMRIDYEPQFILTITTGGNNDSNNYR